MTQAKEKFEEAIRLNVENNRPVFNLGLVYALQGNIDEAHNRWKKGLAMCQGSDDWDDRATRAFFSVILGETEPHNSGLQKILEEKRSAVELLHSGIDYAEILARCPIKPAGIDKVVEMLKQTIG